MRIYKINNQHIDLDHVQIVSDLAFKDIWDEECDAAWFYVTLAFQDKPKRFGFHYSNDLEGLEVVDENNKFIQAHADFLKAWQNKS